MAHIAYVSRVENKRWMEYFKDDVDFSQLRSYDSAKHILKKTLFELIVMDSLVNKTLEQYEDPDKRHDIGYLVQTTDLIQAVKGSVNKDTPIIMTHYDHSFTPVMPGYPDVHLVLPKPNTRKFYDIAIRYVPELLKDRLEND